MKKIIAILVMVSLVFSSCSRSITVQQAANGKAKCGRRLK